MNFDLNDSIIIDIFTGFNSSIRINADSYDLNCKEIYIHSQSRAKRCIVQKNHFENKTNGYYFMNYFNYYTNKYSPFYEMNPVQVIMSQNNENIEKKSYGIKIDNIKNNNKSELNIYLILAICFIILLFIYLTFYMYRKSLRKRKGKLFEGLFVDN